MQRFLRWSIGLPLALLVIGFAIANRQFVELSFDPINPGAPFASIGMPLWLLFFFGIFAGVIIGWIGCWFAQGKHRKRAREAQLQITRLQQERDHLASRAEPIAEQHIVPMGTGWV
jgi:Lipopolysaccharide assembly protein A domain